MNDVGICFLIETEKQICSNHLIHGLWAGADVKWFALDLDVFMRGFWQCGMMVDSRFNQLSMVGSG
jgi:hypothetical protein